MTSCDWGERRSKEGRREAAVGELKRGVGPNALLRPILDLLLTGAVIEPSHPLSLSILVIPLVVLHDPIEFPFHRLLVVSRVEGIG